MRLIFIILLLWAALAAMGHGLVDWSWGQAIVITGTIVGLLCLCLAAMLSHNIRATDAALDEECNWDDPLDGTNGCAIGKNIKNEDL